MDLQVDQPDLMPVIQQRRRHPLQSHRLQPKRDLRIHQRAEMNQKNTNQAGLLEIRPSRTIFISDHDIMAHMWVPRHTREGGGERRGNDQ
jgi:hypothetical protein